MASNTNVFISIALLLSLVALACCSPLINKRVYGGLGLGTDAPFAGILASLRLKNPFSSYHICGGTILSEKLILSAAQCVQKGHTEASSYGVIVGTNLRDEGEVRDVSRFLKHPQFNNDNLQYDIALFELAKPLNLEGYLSLIRMEQLKIGEGESALTMGWGGNSESRLDKSARIGKVTTISNEDCRASLSSNFRKNILDTTLCVIHNRNPDFDEGYPSGIGIDDIGEPLVVYGKLIGIASWYSDKQETPDGYTRISTVEEWISEKIEFGLEMYMI